MDKNDVGVGFVPLKTGDTVQEGLDDRAGVDRAIALGDDGTMIDQPNPAGAHQIGVDRRGLGFFLRILRERRVG